MELEKFQDTLKQLGKQLLSLKIASEPRKLLKLSIMPFSRH